MANESEMPFQVEICRVHVFIRICFFLILVVSSDQTLMRGLCERIREFRWYSLPDLKVIPFRNGPNSVPNYEVASILQQSYFSPVLSILLEMHQLSQFLWKSRLEVYFRLLFGLYVLMVQAGSNVMLSLNFSNELFDVVLGMDHFRRMQGVDSICYASAGGVFCWGVEFKQTWQPFPSFFLFQQCLKPKYLCQFVKRILPLLVDHNIGRRSSSLELVQDGIEVEVSIDKSPTEVDDIGN